MNQKQLWAVIAGTFAVVFFWVFPPHIVEGPLFPYEWYYFRFAPRIQELRAQGLQAEIVPLHLMMHWSVTLVTTLIAYILLEGNTSDAQRNTVLAGSVATAVAVVWFYLNQDRFFGGVGKLMWTLNFVALLTLFFVVRMRSHERKAA